MFAGRMTRVFSPAPEVTCSPRGPWGTVEIAVVRISASGDSARGGRCSGFFSFYYVRPDDPLTGRWGRGPTLAGLPGRRRIRLPPGPGTRRYRGKSNAFEIQSAPHPQKHDWYVAKCQRGFLSVTFMLPADAGRHAVVAVRDSFTMQRT